MNFRRLISIRLYLLTLFEGMLTAGCYTAAVYLTQPINAETYLEYEGGALRIGLVVVMFLLATYLFDFHKQSRRSSRLLLALELSQLMGIILLMNAAFAFISPDLVLPQEIVLVGSGLMLINLILWR